MSGAAEGLASRAAALRIAFDRTFAEPRQIASTTIEDFLAIRFAAEPYVVRLSEIAGLYADKKITRVPGRMAALLGIAGFRGVISPVYDLRSLLGYPKSEAASRWLVMASAASVALAFDALDGHLRIACDAIVRQAADGRSRSHVREFARVQDRIHPILDVASVLDAIRNQVSRAAPGEER